MYFKLDEIKAAGRSKLFMVNHGRNLRLQDQEGAPATTAFQPFLGEWEIMKQAFRKATRRQSPGR